MQLCSYSGEKIPVAGKVEVTVSYRGQVAKAPLVIVQGSGPTLLGRNWLEGIRLDWQKLHSLHPITLQSVLQSHQPCSRKGW